MTYWWEIQTATRAAWSQRRSCTNCSNARSRAAIALLDAADEPQRLPEAVARIGRLLLREHVLERRARVVPARRLERLLTVEEPVDDAGCGHAGEDLKSPSPVQVWPAVLFAPRSRARHVDGARCRADRQGFG